MFAKHNIEKGTILLRERPFIYILNSSLRTEHCDNCFRKGQLLKCSSCQYVYYCGKICQREGWPVHKTECNNFKKVAPRIVPDAARLMARLIQKLNKGGHNIRSHYSRNKFRMFKDLMSHYTDLKVDQRRMEHFMLLYGVLLEFLKDVSLPNSVEVLGIYGRMCINSFNICDSEMKTLGTGIYLAASIINHSCEPTAVATFDDITLFIRSLCDMDYLDWNKVLISYIDILDKPKDRQDELEKQYYFLCKCSRCIDDGISKIMSAAACPNNNCGGYVNMCSTDFDHIVKCEHCGKQLDKDFINRYLEITELNETHIRNMNSLNYLDVCKICLEKSEGILYKLNLQRVKLLDSSFECSIELEQWSDARKYGTELIEGYLFYYNDLNPLVGLLYMKLSKIYFLFEEIKEAQKYLKNAFDILKITHGFDSPLFKREVKPLMDQLAYKQNMSGF